MLLKLMGHIAIQAHLHWLIAIVTDAKATDQPELASSCFKLFKLLPFGRQGSPSNEIMLPGCQAASMRSLSQNKMTPCSSIKTIFLEFLKQNGSYTVRQILGVQQSKLDTHDLAWHDPAQPLAYKAKLAKLPCKTLDDHLATFTWT